MRVVIATVQVPFVRGGAEILAEDLCNSIAKQGNQVEIVRVPWKSFPAASILDAILAFRLLDLSQCVAGPIDLFIGLKFPAYLIQHPNKVLWIAHQHRQAYELWNDRYGLSHDPLGTLARDVIRKADRQVCRECRKIFTISRTVSQRLETFLGFSSVPLYPPPRLAGRLYCDTSQDFLFFPSRIAPHKRHDLVLEALALTREPVRVRFAGPGDPESHASAMRAKAGALALADRVEWLGWISEAELISYYATSQGVLFPPLDEDYGYVTLEAMLASKPVITCSDSGGVLEFLLPEKTGLVAEPEPQALAACMDLLWRYRELARRWGGSGRELYDSLDIRWDGVLEALLT
jgi:glycosyltransferase involved in cell wall biosynthesis